MHYGKYYPKKEIHDSRITEQPTGKPGILTYENYYCLIDF